MSPLIAGILRIISRSRRSTVGSVDAATVISDRVCEPRRVPAPSARPHRHAGTRTQHIAARRAHHHFKFGVGQQRLEAGRHIVFALQSLRLQAAQLVGVERQHHAGLGGEAVQHIGQRRRWQRIDFGRVARAGTSGSAAKTGRIAPAASMAATRTHAQAALAETEEGTALLATELIFSSTNNGLICRPEAEAEKDSLFLKIF